MITNPITLRKACVIEYPSYNCVESYDNLHCKNTQEVKSTVLSKCVYCFVRVFCSFACKLCLVSVFPGYWQVHIFYLYYSTNKHYKQDYLIASCTKTTIPCTQVHAVERVCEKRDCSNMSQLYPK